MFSTGLVFVAVLLGALAVFALLGSRSGWRSAIVLGTGGVAYSIAAYPDYLLIVVFPLSVLLLLIGCVTLVIGRPTQRDTTRRRATAAESDRQE